MSWRTVVSLAALVFAIGVSVGINVGLARFASAIERETDDARYHKDVAEMLRATLAASDSARFNLASDSVRACLARPLYVVEGTP